MAFIMDNAVVVINHTGLSISDENISQYVSQIGINPARDEFDVSTFGSAAHLWQKGAGNNTVNLTIRWPADMALLLQFMQLVESDEHPTFTVRPKNAAKGVGNPEFTFAACIREVPNNGEWNTIFESTVTANINGQVNIDDGVTEIDI